MNQSLSSSSAPIDQKASHLALGTVLILLVLALTGCEKKQAVAAKSATPTAATPAFEPGPAPNRKKDGEGLRVEEAMKVSDVDFLLRTGVSEVEILTEIAERGFLAQVTAAEANALSANGASARLIALVQDRQYVLTPPELAEYNARIQRRGTRGAVAQDGDLKLRQKAFEERQRLIHAQASR